MAININWIILSVFIFFLFTAVAYLLYKNYDEKRKTDIINKYTEELFSLTSVLPSQMRCKLSTLEDVSVRFASNANTVIETKIVDPSVVMKYSTALSEYKKKLNEYNSLMNCTQYCINGIVDSQSNCICPTNAPISHLENGIIYCVDNDLSNIPYSYFNTTTSSFICNDGFSRTASSNNDNRCYNVKENQNVSDYTETLRVSYNQINTSNTFVKAYGQINDFYITSQVNIPQDVVSIDKSYETNTYNCAQRAVTKNANTFSYNPQTNECVCYSTSYSLNGLNQGKFTIGSKQMS